MIAVVFSFWNQSIKLWEKACQEGHLEKGTNVTKRLRYEDGAEVISESKGIDYSTDCAFHVLCFVL